MNEEKINEVVEKICDHYFTYLHKGEIPEIGNGYFSNNTHLPKNLTKVSLYRHQEKAIEEIRRGNHVILSVGTGGGKTEAAIGGIFAKEPMILSNKRRCRAVFVYPTRALTDDQMTRLIKHYGQYNVTRFDSSNRKRNKEASKRPVLSTNPAMLFTHLKYRTKLTNILIQNIQFVILDEFHLYSSHQASLLLASIGVLKKFNTDIQIIVLSATLGEENQLKKWLLKDSVKKVVLITGNGKRSDTLFYLSQQKMPINDECITELIRQLAILPIQSMVFVPYRSIADKLTVQLGIEGEGLPIFRHHGAVPDDEQEKVINRLKTGNPGVYISPRTLAQGVDFPGVNLTVHVGFPSTRAEFTQRIGRSGRKGVGMAYAVIIPIAAFDELICISRETFKNHLNNLPENVALVDKAGPAFLFQCSILDWLSKSSGMNKLKREDYERLSQLGFAQQSGSELKMDLFGEITQELSLTAAGRELLSTLQFYGSGSVSVICDGNEIFQIGISDAIHYCLPGSFFSKGNRVYKVIYSDFPKPQKDYSNNDIKELNFYLSVEEIPNNNPIAKSILLGKKSTSVHYGDNLPQVDILSLNTSANKISRITFSPQSLLVRTLSEDGTEITNRQPVSYLNNPPWIITNAYLINVHDSTVNELEVAIHIWCYSMALEHGIALESFAHKVSPKGEKALIWEPEWGDIHTFIDGNRVLNRAKELLGMSNFSELHLPKCELQAEVINIVRSNVVGRTLVEIAKVMEV